MLVLPAPSDPLAHSLVLANERFTPPDYREDYRDDYRDDVSKGYINPKGCGRCPTPIRVHVQTGDI